MSNTTNLSDLYIQTNVTCDDFDARIYYSDDSLFTTPNPSLNDPNGEYAQYLDGTYHASTSTNASLTYLFQGSSIYVYSTTGPAYGSVAIEVDGNRTIASAYAAQNGTEPFLLYSLHDIYPGEIHNFTMVNLGNTVNASEGNTMLLDFFKTTVELAPVGATLTNHTIEDNNLTALTYTGAWGNNTNELFSGGTTSFTNDSTATVSFSFYGTALYIYGDQNNDHGGFLVEVFDEVTGADRQILTTPLSCGGRFQAGYCEKTDPGVQYSRAYLGPSLHNVTITNTLLDQYNYSYFDLDRIVYTTPSEYLPANYTALSMPEVETGYQAPSTASTAQHIGGAGLSAAATPGGAIAGTMAFAALFLHIFGF